MEILAKLIAAADSCESGESVNLDELSFLLRYAAEELQQVLGLRAEHERLVAQTRERLLARSSLLKQDDGDRALIEKASLEELEKLDRELDRQLRAHFEIDEPAPEIPASSHTPLQQYRSGR